MFVTTIDVDMDGRDGTDGAQEETLPEIAEIDDLPENVEIVTEKDGKNENPNESEDEGETAKRYPRRTQRSTLLEDTGLPPLIANMGWGGKQIKVTIRIEGGSLQMSSSSLVGGSPRLVGRGGRGRGGRGREYISFRFVCSYHGNGLRFRRFHLACSSLQRFNPIDCRFAHTIFIPGGRGRGRGGSGRGHGGRGSGEKQPPVVQPFVGDDGNLFYCHMCRDVGDVVCCDGCPNVYHPTCVPPGMSRSSLDADEDPWYCPECFDNHHNKRTRANSTASRASDAGRRNKRKSSIGAADDEESGRGFGVSGRGRGKGRGRGGRGGRGSLSPKRTLELELPQVAKKGPGRSKLSEDEKEERRRIKELSEMLYDEADDEERERRNNNDNDGHDINLQDEYEDIGDYDGIASMISSEGVKPTGATPAFFIFLAENRQRIEKHMIKRYRSFRSMRRGYERNALVAKEGAALWLKLSAEEQRKFVDKSIEDFETRVVEWKHNECIGAATGAGTSEQIFDDIDDIAEDSEDVTYWRQRHHHLLSSSQIRCSPLGGSDRARNQLLLDLLQDMRFHPVPTVDLSRSGDQSTKLNGPVDPGSKVALAQYQVQGPVATSVGDECIGCTRGWNHFCPVLQATVPAVQYRAKLQPPVTALMATRVGLGLKVPTERREVVMDKDRRDPCLPVPGFYLTEPNTRMDDLTEFVDHLATVRLHETMPEVLAGDEETRPAAKLLTRGILPTSSARRKNKSDNVPNEDEPKLYKCIRCKKATTSSLGCVGCRGNKLIAVMTKSNNYGSSRQSLQVQNTVLRGAPLNDDNFDKQTKGERATAQVMAGSDWKPSAMLPFEKLLIGSSNLGTSSISVENSSDLDASSQDTKVEDITDFASAADASPTTLLRVDSSSSSDTSTSDNSDEEDNDESKHMPSPVRHVRKGKKKHDDASTIRSEDLVAHKKEAQELHRRCVFIATSGILLSMIRRDPLRLFAEAVPNSVVEYRQVVKRPIDFSVIRQRVLRGHYTSLSAFSADATLLCANALIFNPAGTIYAITAQDLYELLSDMEIRANKWISAIKTSHSTHFSKKFHQRSQTETAPMRTLRSRISKEGGDDESKAASEKSDPYEHLRSTWPGAAEVLDSEEWLREELSSDFMRTKENEAAYYGRLAIRRMATASQASRADYLESGGIFHPILRRSHVEDRALRCQVDGAVAAANRPIQLKDKPSWRENQIYGILKIVQSRRVDNMTSSESGCARGDGSRNEDAQLATAPDSKKRKWKQNDGRPRIHQSRFSQSTGLASANAREQKILRVDIDDEEKLQQTIISTNSSVARDDSVSIRGSSIQGWGLFAEHRFDASEVVAEYLGEWINNAMCEKRELIYRDMRIQDYQFRVSEDLVIDATLKGGYARYINHSCEPNCIAKIVCGAPPNERLMRVIIVARYPISEGTELTYDYQFPLEADYESRIVCQCGADKCRGFMNWDMPERDRESKKTKLV